MTQYIREVVQAVRSGENVIIESAWARVQEALAEKGLSAASKLFDDLLRTGLASLKAEIVHAKGSHLVAQFCSSSDGVPLEEEEMERIVEEASEKAQAKLAGLAHGCEPTRHQGAAVALQQHAIQELKQLKSENREVSEAYCSLVAQEVCTQLQSEVSNSSGTDVGLQDLLQIAVDEYGSSARGPAKCRVGHRHMERMSREVGLRQDAREQLRMHQEEAQHLMLLQEAQHLEDMEKKDLAQRDANWQLLQVEAQLQEASETLQRLAEESEAQQRRWSRRFEQLAQDQEQIQGELRRQHEQQQRELARQQEDMRRRVERLKHEQRAKERQIEDLSAEVTRLANRPPEVIQRRSSCSVM